MNQLVDQQAVGQPEQTIAGEVIHGDKRGRLLGFPTANLRLPVRGNRPRFGIYYGLVDGQPAAISIGVRPTFGDGLEPLLEAHILDFDGDLYGQTVEVRLLQHLRDEENFDSVDRLVAQIRRDVLRVRSLHLSRSLASSTRS